MARMIDWIEVKRQGLELDAGALRAVVNGFTSGEIPDYQMSAWLMAVTLKGMSLDETCALTDAMLDSGETLDLSSLPRPTLDKHSSGGVGDKVTLALVPMLAAAGAHVAKMSGRSLGLTGGTLDKLESVPGLRTSLASSEIISQVRRIGACICAQSDQLAPADRAVYALRDATATVASIPLIASSIMSKKLACNADALVLDIKVGRGAFLREMGDARQLARTCLAIAARHGKRAAAVISDMDQPLGRAVGNAIELREAAALVKPGAAKPEKRLSTLTATLFSQAATLSGGTVLCEADAVLGDGSAYSRLLSMIEAQGGRVDFFDEDGGLDDLQASVPVAWAGGAVTAKRSGYVSALDAERVARVAAMLGDHRDGKHGDLDSAAGIWLGKTIGEPVEAGVALAWMNSSDAGKLSIAAREALLSAYEFSAEPPPARRIVLDVILSVTADNLNMEGERGALTR